ncbi:asparagine synthase (glutamine-hydrolyzing) [Brevifollis gellanilyticus]|uniref:asparagine synthase (glutamine-hydrolyzing) n=1 Tax=Brevifollis gellanilyticus TaxID=748831 RepID=A0A512MCZ0_9BACT|nr:asparagine synthase (glutamine-hydrolyzing) [Brevifollis gellanilyticus]GEP44596.1 asparagine synthetase B [Brevifollis gellanilyticus]
MCGFAGWFQKADIVWPDDARQRQERALKALNHRGPDDGGETRGPTWWMGFRRLSILDLSDHAHQPMSFDGGHQTLTFNGEIYNFRELRETLGRERLSSTGDTAVLGALLSRQRLGRVLPQLRGMFAFAWRDETRRTLCLARDHFGIKPLYYHLDSDGTLRYASEMRTLRALLGSKASALSPQALTGYLRWGCVQAPDTTDDGIRCLPPGHRLIWQDGEIEVERWFMPVWQSQNDWIRDEDEQRHMVRMAVLDSVRAHLIADVPVGVFLSGGLDSSLMAGAMRHLGQKKIKAFSLGYDVDAGVPDETQAAERTAHALGCDFHAECMSAAAVESLLDDYIGSLDQPTGDALNTWLVSRLAARDVKVVLSGLGADEWWAGYTLHRLASLTMRSPLKHFGCIARGFQSLLPGALHTHPSWKAAFFALGGHGHTPAQIQRSSRALFMPSEVARITGQSWSENSEGQRIAREAPLSAPDSWLHELLRVETETYLADMLLRDNDVVSMAHSLELRVPLVDKHIFALSARLPPESKMTTRRGKIILREACKDLLPAHIYDDKQKKTFTLPLMKWMRTPAWRARIEDTLYSTACRQRGWLQPREVEKLCAAYFNSSVETKRGWSLSQRVWVMYVLEAWASKNA